jgi:hypothetical protein
MFYKYLSKEVENQVSYLLRKQPKEVMVGASLWANPTA